MICNRRANAINGVVWIGCGDVRLGNRIHTFPTPLGVSLNAAPISTYSLFPLIVVYLVYVVMCKNCSFSRKHPLPPVPLSPCPPAPVPCAARHRYSAYFLGVLKRFSKLALSLSFASFNKATSSW